MISTESDTARLGETPTSSASSQTPPPQGQVTNGSLTKLVSGILDDAQKLARQQFEMLKAEVREDFNRTRQAAEFGATGIVLMTVGILGLITAFAYFLHEHYQFSMWASWGITGLLFTLLGSACAGASYVLLNRFNPLPDKTLHALEENLSWKTEPTNRVS